MTFLRKTSLATITITERMASSQSRRQSRSTHPSAGCEMTARGEVSGSVEHRGF
ncbi:hypothetical protein [Bradyrhizobium sp. WSM2793]|uniref:hypothetical protein n=1 Tax=Bradyrhizobium sp. WSM2793 TaxID=1038866 RepID=UPI0003A2F8DD|nr:hypothetical protein [Bradyrhizobium sp. WSM2793]